MASDELSESERLNALGQLSAGVGHHVINAFATIVSNAEILRIPAPPRAVDPVGIANMIIKTAVDASGVARRLIDYSRSATATGPERIEPDRLIREVIDREMPARGLNVGWAAEPGDVPAIHGSVDQLHLMFGHLIDNACEAMAEAGGTITLATGRDERGWVVIEVRDTGPGLTREVQERAVEPFFTTRPGHNGVGLSIAHGIWRRHRGTLSIRGEPGQGAKVRLCVEPADGAPRPTFPGIS